MSFIKQTTPQDKEHLINLNQVVYIEKTNSGFAQFHLADGSVVYVRENFYTLEKELCNPIQKEVY